jgi:hypothetical protein
MLYEPWSGSRGGAPHVVAVVAIGKHSKYHSSHSRAAEVVYLRSGRREAFSSVSRTFRAWSEFF